MTDDANNPRKLATACRIFQAGAIGHRFGRPLTPARENRLQAIIRPIFSESTWRVQGEV